MTPQQDGVAVSGKPGPQLRKQHKHPGFLAAPRTISPFPLALGTAQVFGGHGLSTKRFPQSFQRQEAQFSQWKKLKG